MTDAANTPPTTRAARVITIVAVVIAVVIAVAVAYMGLRAFVSVPQLTDFIGGRDIDYPVFLAIAAVAGPTLFWAFIGLGLGLTVVGWAAGIASTGILASLTYGWLLAPPTATASLSAQWKAVGSAAGRCSPNWGAPG
ncbi:hypothetical protein ACGFX2_32840 [Streptomyces goshikiensis]|uniref:hypothetical protein n=1 Tax=Streptomyces goshikiensis TaxID=1942 RepID=UPI003714EA94